jgi:hypothetical protein
VDGYQWTYSDRDPVSRANFISNLSKFKMFLSATPIFEHSRFFI